MQVRHNADRHSCLIDELKSKGHARNFTVHISKNIQRFLSQEDILMILDFIPHCRVHESGDSDVSSESHLCSAGEIEDICVPPVEKRKLDPDESRYLGEVKITVLP